MSKDENMIIGLPDGTFLEMVLVRGGEFLMGSGNVKIKMLMLMKGPRIR